MSEHASTTPEVMVPTSHTPGPTEETTVSVDGQAFQRPLTTDVLLRLQRQVGNRVVERLIDVRRADEPSAGQGVAVVQRDQPPLPLVKEPAAGVAILPDDRQRVKDETSMEISTAFTAFTDACQANLTAMKAAAKANAELAALFIDIATGFLAPAFANVVASKLLAKAGTAVKGEVSKQAVNKLISQSDLLKGSFTGATKAVSAVIKAKSTQLFGEAAEDALLDGLKTEFQRNAVALAGMLGTMSDDQLIATWVAYDVDSANVTAYKGAINNLLTQFHTVQTIAESAGSASRVGMVTEHHRAYRIDAYGKSDRLILLDETTTSWSGQKKRFQAWIPEYFEDMAVKLNNQIHGSTTKIDPSAIDGHFPDPVTGK